MRLFYFISSVLSINVHFFFRTQHPMVNFHKKRLEETKTDLKRQINEFKLSKSVKFDTLHPKNGAVSDYYSDFTILNALPRLNKVNNHVLFIPIYS
jgi:hypothetical protein